MTDRGKSNPTSVVSTAMGSVNSSMISVSVKRTNIQRTALKMMVSCCMTSENGQDLDQHSALRLLMIQQPPLLPLRPAPHPPLPHTLRFGEVESGRSIRSSEPGPKSLSVPCLEDKKYTASNLLASQVMKADIQSPYLYQEKRSDLS